MRELARLSIGLLVLLVAPPTAVAEPPPFRLDRSAEIYNPADLKEGFNPAPEPYKYLPLSGDGATYLSLGGELRERFDYFDAPAFGIGRPEDSYDLQRLLLHADLHFGRHVRLFAQLGHHDAYGKHAPLSPTDQSATNVQNLFADIAADKAGHWRLRVGRQEMYFNSTQRFVSVREGPNLRLSFDGGRLTWHRNNWTVDAFGLRPVIVHPGAWNNQRDSDTWFSGLYITHALNAQGASLEGYWFEWNHHDSRYGATVGDERRRTVGLRFAAKRDRWDTDTELAWQYGTFAGRDVRAWAVGSDLGYSMPLRFQPRAGLRVDGASGDSTSHSGELGTFNPLYPKGLYFDESTLTTYANLWSIRPNITLTPSASWSIQLSEAWRWRESRHDALYLIPLVPINRTFNATSSYVGRWTVLDLLWRTNRWLSFHAEYVHVETGAAIRDVGGNNVNFAMLTAQYRF